MTAYAYLRKSSVHALARETSYEMQEAAVREMAARHGDDNGALVLLSDWDKSGRLGADKRPGYAALLEAIDSGRATALYSYSLSRLARSVPELSRLVARCVERGIPVRLYADHVDTSTASGRLLTHVLASVAEFEADVTSERIRAANAAKLARGESLSTVHKFGDRDGEDAAAVLAAFREADSFSGAAKLLNERGIKPRTSTRGWWPSAVSVVVHRLDRRVIVGRSRRGASAGGSAFILAGLLHCPTCGTRLTGTRDRDGRRVRYSCRLGTARPHPRISVTEHLILPAVRAEVARQRDIDPTETASADGGRRADLGDRRARILDMFEAGHIDRADRERRLNVVRDDLERLDARQVVREVPRIEWEQDVQRPRELNAVLRALFSDVRLDPETFQPVAFTWLVPEWRSDDEAAA